MYFSLEDICPEDGTKRQLFIDTDVSIFKFNSSFVPDTVFKCHVELEVKNSNYGFSVFIGTVNNRIEIEMHCIDYRVAGFVKMAIYASQHLKGRFGCFIL